MAYINGNEVLFSPSVNYTNRMQKLLDKSITELTLADTEGADELGQYACIGCADLKNAVIAATVAIVNTSVFYNCTALESVIFEDNGKCERICSNAFFNCKNLKYIRLPKNLKQIDNAFLSCAFEKIDIPESVQIVLADAFNKCNNLASVTFHGTPTQIWEAFYRCNALTDIYVPWAEGEVENAPWGATNATIHYNYKEPTEGLAYTLSSDGLYYICDGIGTATDNDITLACYIDGVTVNVINDYAFSENKNITSVYIPDTVKKIGSRAFYQCSNIKSVRIPSNVKINANAFNYCDLTTLILPNGITFSGGAQFGNSNNLKSVIFKGIMASVPENAFHRCGALTDIYVPWSEGEVANAPWGATNATIHYNSEV